MAKANPFRFSTKYQDEETDLLYYGYRYYNTSIGRWPGRDPMAELGGCNLYRFLNNDAVLAVDYLGLRSVKSIQCVVGVKEDGLSGPKTAAAIKAFQQLLILAGCLKEGGADGAWGPATEAAYETCKKKDSLSVPGKISFYCPCKICCGPNANRKCADTTPFATGVLAAPRPIPFGSTVSFTIDGENYTGTVHDRGGAIQLSGKLCRIDRGLDIPHTECEKKGKINAQLTIDMNWRDCDSK